MSEPSIIRQISDAELRLVISDTFARFPELSKYYSYQKCCSGCLYTEIGMEVGWEAANAWEKVSDARWLLGEEPK